MAINHRPELTKEKIQNILNQQMSQLAETYGVVSLGLFGSFARNEQNMDSDIDLLVKIDNPHMTLLQFIKLRNYLSDLMGIEVDLVEPDMLKPALGTHILSEVELL